MAGMDIGVLLPTGAAQWGADGDPRELVAFGRRAERSGYSSLFVNDSLISPRIEALTMLAALAPATGTVALGSADSFDGEILRFAGIPPATRPFRAGGPPIWLGGATPAALARTGLMYDGWLPYPPDPADYASGLADIRKAAADAGRTAGDITPALFVSVRVDESAESGRRALDDYARANYGVPLAELEKIQAVVTGSADQVRAGLARYVEAGARHIVVRLGALDLHSQREQLELVAALIPAGWRRTATKGEVRVNLDEGRQA
jgi:alkanesulfonate monooxygenase SsuD/methylene tetrahydromethanopterin reductase-like flavin-dependent oxidoreductase (luciferase family)